MGEVMVKIVKGNLLDATEDIIAHQVNCMGVMGSGLAKQIRNKYPEVYANYKDYLKNYKGKILGSAQSVVCHDGKIVFNLFGQYGYGRDKQYTDYNALKSALSSLYLFTYNKNLSIAFPYNLGCGLAGGDWNVVYKIIEEVFNDYDVNIYNLD